MLQHGSSSWSPITVMQRWPTHILGKQCSLGHIHCRALRCSFAGVTRQCQGNNCGALCVSTCRRTARSHSRSLRSLTPSLERTLVRPTRPSPSIQVGDAGFGVVWVRACVQHSRCPCARYY